MVITHGNGPAPPAVDVKSLHAKIGELTLENATFLFLIRALLGPARPGQHLRG
jgi:hypothetical protein